MPKRPIRLRDSSAGARGRGAAKAGAAIRKHLRPSPCTSDAPYGDDEAEYLRAVAAYRERSGRRFLTACEYLDVAKGLGYAKEAPHVHD